jgi:ABC-2 type transport system permease protein
VVAHVVRLKLTILANSLRRSPWQVVGLLVASLYGLGIAWAVVGAAIGVSTQDLEIRAQVATILGAALVLGWWFVPLVAFGADATLDPVRFATSTIRRRDLLVGLALAALVGVPGVLSALAALSLGATWWKDPAALVAGLVGSVLGLAVAVLGGRAIVTAASRVLAGRRGREVVAVLIVLVSLGVVFGASRASSIAVHVDRHTFEGLARAVGWTPFGAPWAVAADVARQDWPTALAHLAIAAVTVVGAVAAWSAAISRTVEAPRHESTGRSRGLGWFGRVPGSQLGAVVARCLTYWARDPRYALALVIVPVLPLLLWFVGRGGALALVSGPVAALLTGWGISAEVAYDGTAHWTHLAAPLRGVTDRLGRVIAAACVAVPLLALVAVAGALLAGRPEDIAAVGAATLGLLLVAYGGASIASALVVYPVQQPGENPFQSRQGASLAAITSQFLGWSAVIVVSLPTLVLAWLTVQHGSGWLLAALVVVALGIGSAALAVGVRLGGRVLDARGPALFVKLLSYE